jgi:hypothetical protein
VISATAQAVRPVLPRTAAGYGLRVDQAAEFAAIRSALTAILKQLKGQGRLEAALLRWRADAPLTAKDVAAIRGVTPQAVWAAVSRGQLRRAGAGPAGFTRRDVEEWCVDGKEREQ